MRIRNKPWAKVELLASPFYVQKPAGGQGKNTDTEPAAAE